LGKYFSEVGLVMVGVLYDLDGGRVFYCLVYEHK
jgi:hypothetical protein